MSHILVYRVFPTDYQTFTAALPSLQTFWKTIPGVEAYMNLEPGWLGLKSFPALNVVAAPEYMSMVVFDSQDSLMTALNSDVVIEKYRELSQLAELDPVITIGSVSTMWELNHE